MAAVATTQPQGGDIAGIAQDVLRKAYEQILELRDSVLIGNNPNLRLSEVAKQRLRETAASTPSKISSSALSTMGATVLPSQVEAIVSHNKGAFVANQRGIPLSAVSEPESASFQLGVLPTSSSADAFHVSQSRRSFQDGFQSRRKALEAVLKEESERYKRGQIEKPNELDGPGDITAILQRAHALVKPLSGLRSLQRPQQSSRDTSFDENDYYSSKASSWSSDRQSAAVVNSMPSTNQTPGGLAQSFPGLTSSAFQDSLSTSFSSAKQSNVEKSIDVEPSGMPGPDYSSSPSDADMDESDYTPPAADAFTDIDADNDTMGMDEDDDSEYDPQSNLPVDFSNNQVPVIANRLNHLDAPQPSRVSPLAVSKVPGLGSAYQQSKKIISQNRRTTDQPASALHNDAGTDTTSNSRHIGQAPKKGKGKKQKIDEGRAEKRSERRRKIREEKARKRQELKAARAKRKGPSVKKEPMSPPTMTFPLSVSSTHTHTPVTNGRSAPRIQVDSPGDIQYHPSRPLQAGYTSNDLRKVASLNAAGRPHSPGAEPSPRIYSPVGPYRVSSANHREPQYIQQLHPRMEQAPSATGMHPPGTLVRQIVTDQFGVKYYALTAPKAEQYPSSNDVSVAGEPLRSSVAPNAHMDQRRTAYEPSSNGTAMYIRPAQMIYENEEPMPPPPQYARRVVSYPEQYHQEIRQPAQSYHEPMPEPYTLRQSAMGPPPPPPQRIIGRAEMPPPEHHYQPSRAASVRPEQNYPSQPVYVRQPADAERPRHEYQQPSAPPAPYPARAYSVHPEQVPAVRYISRQSSMMPPPPPLPQPDSVYQAPTRAMSVIPGQEYGRAQSVQAQEYAPRYPEIRHSYAPAPGPASYEHRY